MTDILVQFHALPEEFLPLLEKKVSELNVYVAKVLFPPYEASPIQPKQLATALENPQCTGFVLSCRPIVATRSQSVLDGHHPDALHVEVGRRTPEGLRESSLAARAADPTVTSAWRQIAKEVKKATTAGVEVMNPAYGASSHNRTHRFSAGAKKLDEAGVPILTLNNLPLKLTGNG